MKIFINDQGAHNGKDWIKSLNEKDYKKLYRHFLKLESHGQKILKRQINFPDIKPLQQTNGLWQIRINQYRALFFFYDNANIIVTHGFSKKEDELAPNEIEIAQNIKNHFQL